MTTRAGSVPEAEVPAGARNRSGTHTQDFIPHHDTGGEPVRYSSLVAGNSVAAFRALQDVARGRGETGTDGKQDKDCHQYRLGNIESPIHEFSVHDGKIMKD